MRKVALFLLLYFPFVIFAQINESFTDGDFTQKPLWQGTPNIFIVNSDNQLQLNATTSGTAYLSTAQSFDKGQVWEFWIKLGFNPSSQNYEKVWLTTNTINPDESTVGYFVHIGGTADKVSLRKKNKTTETEIIAGIDKELDKSTVSLQIKVEYTAGGEWKLYVRQDSESNYTLKGQCQDDGAIGGEYFSLQSIYTTSYAKKVWFDDLSITAVIVRDTIPPTVKNVNLINENQLSVSFSEPVDSGSVLFSVLGLGRVTLAFSSDCKSVILTFNKAFQSGLQNVLNISGVKDLSGNVMQDSSFPFVYWPVLENANMGDVVISEIMANPNGITELPDVEYVELHNNSGKIVRLLNWVFYYGDKEFVLPEYKLMPDSNVIICASDKVDLFSSQVNKVGLVSFPLLANSGKLLWLESSDGVVSSFVDYNDKWYLDDFRANGGFSLECIDVTNLSGSSANWRSSQSRTGGTPGAKNSVAAEDPDQITPTLLRSSLKNPACVALHFSKPMDKSTLTDLNNYVITTGSQSIKKAEVSTPIPNEVFLTLTDSLRQGETLALELSTRIRCISGNKLSDNQDVKLAIPDSLSINDIVINEILFDPHPNGEDYVELYNRSDKIIDLSQLQLSARKSDGTLQAGVRLSTEISPFFPGEYLVLTTDKNAVCSFYDCKSLSAFLELDSMPSMPNDDGNIQLVNTSAEIIDGFAYSAKMHHPFVKNTEGVALEKVNADLPSSDSSNWQSASTEAGYGTPGYRNSQQYSAIVDQKGFWLESETVTPDNNGVEDILRVHYALDEPGFVANLRIYDRSGYLVKQIASNEILGTLGILTWDATNSTGQMVSPGIYILMLEYYKSNHSVVQKKMPVVVGN